VAVGVTLAAVGAASSALGDVAHGTLAYMLVGEVDPEQSLHIQERLYSQPLLAAVSMPALLLPLGMIVLGADLLYSRACRDRRPRSCSSRVRRRPAVSVVPRCGRP
jgi:hypothetical protein